METYRMNQRMFFEKFKSIKEGFKARTSIMKDEDNNLISDPGQIVNNFRIFFERLLNNNNYNQYSNDLSYGQVIRDTIEPEVLEPNQEEIEQIVNTLKNNKSPGEDNINSELLNIGGKDFLKTIQFLIAKVWRSEQIENDWRMAIICPIFKKGDPSRVENYRGISLLQNTIYCQVR